MAIRLFDLVGQVAGGFAHVAEGSGRLLADHLRAALERSTNLARRLPEPRDTILLVEFQAEGTRGRSPVNGVTRADRGEILTWLLTFGREPETGFVTHSGPAASEALARVIRRELGWTAVAPRLFERVSPG